MLICSFNENIYITECAKKMKKDNRQKISSFSLSYFLEVGGISLSTIKQNLPYGDRCWCAILSH